jgi:hypothetical protein
MNGRIARSSQGVIVRQPDTGIIVRETMSYDALLKAEWTTYGSGGGSMVLPDFDTAVQSLWVNPVWGYSPYCCSPFFSMDPGWAGGPDGGVGRVHIRLTNYMDDWRAANARGVECIQVPPAARGQKLLGMLFQAGWDNNAYDVFHNKYYDSYGVAPPVYVGFSTVDNPHHWIWEVSPWEVYSTGVYAREIPDMPGYIIEVPKIPAPDSFWTTYTKPLNAPLELKEWLYIWFTALPAGEGVEDPGGYLPVRGTDAEVYLSLKHQAFKLLT